MGGIERSETMSRDQIIARWGFKCSVKTLFGAPKGQLNDKLEYQTVNKIVQLTTKLSQILTEAKFMTSEPLPIARSPQFVKDDDTMKVLNWHLLKGGLKVPNLEGVTDIDKIIKAGFQ